MKKLILITSILLLNNNLIAEVSVEIGKKLFTEQTCNTCHSLDGTKLIGPSFKGLYNRKGKLTGGAEYLADDEYLTESILNPQAKLVDGFPPIMIPYKGKLDTDQVKSLIEYIKTIK